jgi:hypothetical protein
MASNRITKNETADPALWNEARKASAAVARWPAWKRGDAMSETSHELDWPAEVRGLLESLDKRLPDKLHRIRNDIFHSLAHDDAEDAYRTMKGELYWFCYGAWAVLEPSDPLEGLVGKLLDDTLKLCNSYYDWRNAQEKNTDGK